MSSDKIKHTCATAQSHLLWRRLSQWGDKDLLGSADFLQCGALAQAMQGTAGWGRGLETIGRKLWPTPHVTSQSLFGDPQQRLVLDLHSHPQTAA